MKIYILLDSCSECDYESSDNELGYFSSMERLLEEKSRLERYEECREIFEESYFKVLNKQKELAETFRKNNPKPEYPIKVIPHSKGTIKSIKNQQEEYSRVGRVDLAEYFLEIYNNMCAENSQTHNEYNQTILPKYTTELKLWESNKVNFVNQNTTEFEQKILNTRYFQTIYLPLHFEEVELDCTEYNVDEEFINQVKEYKEQ